MAILAAAAARGWRLADVNALVKTTGGQPAVWRGLAQLYERPSMPYYG